MSENETVYVWPDRPTGVDLWPAATYPVHCSPGGVTMARNANNLVEGTIRFNAVSNSYEVLSGGDLHVWKRIDPTRPPITSLVLYRVGPCWVGGHGHGQDGMVGASEDDWFPRINGRAPTTMEKVDIKYYPMNNAPLGIWWLKREYERLTGETPVQPPVAPPVPAQPPMPPVPPSVPPVPPVTPPPPAPPVVEPPPQPAPPLAGPPARVQLSADSRATITAVRERIKAGKNVGHNLQERLIVLFSELDKLS